MTSVTLTDKQHVTAGVTILDEDGQAFEVLPEGFALSFVSDNPDVAGVNELDATHIEVTSGKVGFATITASATFPDGTAKTDSLAVTVINSAPGALNLTVGEPAAE